MRKEVADTVKKLAVYGVSGLTLEGAKDALKVLIGEVMERQAEPQYASTVQFGYTTHSDEFWNRLKSYDPTKPLSQFAAKNKAPTDCTKCSTAGKTVCDCKPNGMVEGFFGTTSILDESTIHSLYEQSLQTTIDGLRAGMREKDSEIQRLSAMNKNLIETRDTLINNGMAADMRSSKFCAERDDALRQVAELDQMLNKQIVDGDNTRRKLAEQTSKIIELEARLATAPKFRVGDKVKWGVNQTGTVGMITSSPVPGEGWVVWLKDSMSHGRGESHYTLA